MWAPLIVFVCSVCQVAQEAVLVTSSAQVLIDKRNKSSSMLCCLYWPSSEHSLIQQYIILHYKQCFSTWFLLLFLWQSMKMCDNIHCNKFKSINILRLMEIRSVVCFCSRRSRVTILMRTARWVPLVNSGGVAGCRTATRSGPSGQPRRRWWRGGCGLCIDPCLMPL